MRCWACRCPPPTSGLCSGTPNIQLPTSCPKKCQVQEMGRETEPCGCVFYRYPVADWEALVGMEADRDNCVEVGLGVADPGADPHKPVRVVALALASRRPENPFIRVAWYPKVESLPAKWPLKSRHGVSLSKNLSSL